MSEPNNSIADVAVSAYAGARAAQGDFTPLVFVLLFAGLGGSTFTGLLGWYIALMIIAAAIILPVLGLIRLGRWLVPKLVQHLPPAHIPAVSTAITIFTPAGWVFVAIGLIVWGLAVLLLAPV
jgi:hypothetical protein